jgi:hypothetical protein
LEEVVEEEQLVVEVVVVLQLQPVVDSSGELL